MLADHALEIVLEKLIVHEEALEQEIYNQKLCIADRRTEARAAPLRAILGQVRSDQTKPQADQIPQGKELEKERKERLKAKRHQEAILRGLSLTDDLD